MSRRALLLIADSERDADMLYVAGLFVPDAFVAIGIDGVWHGLFSPLEVDRARKTSKLHAVHDDSPWRQKADAFGFAPMGLAAVAAAFLKEHGIERLDVPGNFPLMHAEQLRAWGFSVQPRYGSLFPERAIKNEHEIALLQKAVNLTKSAMRLAERLLADATIGGDGILRHPGTGARMKSQHVRSAIEMHLVAKGAMPAHTIVACGRESADPHNTGHGFLRAAAPIIIDIFPRVLAHGYWGDMTRTYAKGSASIRLRKLYRTVREGQDIGLGMVAAGVSGRDIHQAISSHFTNCGFPTGIRRGRHIGFFHGTGHGVGLDIHESPRISPRGDVLAAGQVVTVEPGLYYPGLGGVRLEDMVVVREGHADNLTRYPRHLVIP